jgi:hypothetical protein
MERQAAEPTAPDVEQNETTFSKADYCGSVSLVACCWRSRCCVSWSRGRKNRRRLSRRRCRSRGEQQRGRLVILQAVTDRSELFKVVAGSAAAVCVSGGIALVTKGIEDDSSLATVLGSVLALSPVAWGFFLLKNPSSSSPKRTEQAQIQAHPTATPEQPIKLNLDKMNDAARRERIARICWGDAASAAADVQASRHVSGRYEGCGAIQRQLGHRRGRRPKRRSGRSHPRRRFHSGTVRERHTRTDGSSG